VRRAISGVLESLSYRLFLDDAARLAAVSTERDLVEDVERARKEWASARAYFDAVSDPELVDHAVYLLKAAERKYLYLLKKARDAGVSL